MTWLAHYEIWEACAGEKMLLIAVFADTNTDWTNVAQYGILGIVLIMIIMGKLVPGYILERKDAEADKRDQRINELEEKIQERIIPAIVECNKLMAEVVRMLDDIKWDRMPQRPPRDR